MCTLSILARTHQSRTEGSVRDRPAEESASARRDPWLLRVVCNRDERRTRPPALPPEVRTQGGATAIMPIDPESDGTWLTATDAGLILALLNSSEAAATGPGRFSRGGIIPALLGCESLEHCVAAAQELDPADFSPFRLLVINAHEVHALRTNGRTWTESLHWTLNQPRMFASSGLGDQVVTARRSEVFAECFAGEVREETAVEFAQRQDAFHNHCWPAERSLSVLMSRDDARTVSQTTIELSAHRATMWYRPIGEDAPMGSAPALAPLALPLRERCGQSLPPSSGPTCTAT